MDTADLQVARDLGLLEEEYERIIEILGRRPNFTELSIYSVMWSEHCSYKNSIKWLKTLPREGDHLLVEAGEENAGLVDLGDGLACAFKIESHNHPSALEPYQGAATGVGGIHRDIFTMGARPIAALNSLRFGDPAHKRTRHLVRGVVKGIGDYGNCFGVPTVAGEVYFDPVYQTNPLVNAMSVGIVKTDRTVSATSHGVGNPVFIVGSATGKDGIAGAAFASKDITEDSADDLPAVQVGDPFQEKLLLEASLELIETGCVVGMQDMGAAGITCSTCEMSEKGGHGMRIDLSKVPTRQDDMKGWEILLSESQERMLVVVEAGREQEALDVFEKWDLNCVRIGEVTAGDDVEYTMDGEVVARVPAPSLVLGGGAPVYDRAYTRPAYLDELKRFSIHQTTPPDDLVAAAETVITSPNIASKHWIYEQYDSMVGIVNTSVNHPSDATMVRVPDSDKCLAVTVDCNARYVWGDPYTGAMIAVSEAARNIVCSGGRPSAITNCLNFGNPYNPEVYDQFVQAIRGMTAACTTFDTPVTGGNVSFYNQSSDDGPVFPTPTIGMIGVVDGLDARMTLDLKAADHAIYLIGASRNDIASSEYLLRVHGERNSPAPAFDLEEEARIQEFVARLIAGQHVASAHDVSEGGLFTTLLESAMPGRLGFEIASDDTVRIDAFLFGESQSRVVVSASPDQVGALEEALAASDVAWRRLGTATDGHLRIDDMDFGHIEDWAARYDNALESALGLS